MVISSIINESSTIELPVSSVSGGQYTAVGLSEDGVVTGGIPLGIMVEEPAETVTVQVAGGGYWLAGGGISAGDLLAADEEGKAIKATSGAYALAMALNGATAGSIAQVQLIHGGKV